MYKLCRFAACESSVFVFSMRAQMINRRIAFGAASAPSGCRRSTRGGGAGRGQLAAIARSLWKEGVTCMRI